MNENDELYELEKRYYSVDKKLEKEKTKRILILICIYSFISGYIVSHFFDTIDLKAVLEIIVIAIISGVLLCIVPLLIFSFVTDLFTNISDLEDNKKYLTEEIKRIRRNY